VESRAVDLTRSRRVETVCTESTTGTAFPTCGRIALGTRPPPPPPQQQQQQHPCRNYECQLKSSSKTQTFFHSIFTTPTSVAFTTQTSIHLTNLIHLITNLTDLTNLNNLNLRGMEVASREEDDQEEGIPAGQSVKYREQLLQAGKTMQGRRLPEKMSGTSGPNMWGVVQSLCGASDLS